MSEQSAETEESSCHLFEKRANYPRRARAFVKSSGK